MVLWSLTVAVLLTSAPASRVTVTSKVMVTSASAARLLRFHVRVWPVVASPSASGSIASPLTLAVPAT